MSSQDIVDLLNKTADLDAAALDALIEKRVDINQALATSDLPLVVCPKKTQNGEIFQMGLLGILNGIVAADNKKLIALYDEAGKLNSFRLVAL